MLTDAPQPQPSPSPQPAKKWYQLASPAAGATSTPLRPAIDRLRTLPLADEANSWLITMGIATLAFIMRVTNIAYPRNLVFDETYYAKDAWALLHGGFERNWADGADAQAINGDFSVMKETGSFIVHPPVGKWLIALGEQLFGFNSFGWRIMACIFGALLIAVVIRMTRRLSRSTMIGALAGILLTFDGLHFVMSRIALLDIFQAFFSLAAVAALIADRDWFRNKLANHLEKSGKPDLAGQFGPMVWWRPWRLAAGLLFGLACATKWNSMYLLAVFSIVSVLWDLGARRLAGAGRQQWKSLLTDAPLAFVYHVIVAVIVYLASWVGWLTSAGGYDRDWAANNPSDPSVRILGGPLASLWHYHTEIYGFHTGDGIKQATHVYEAHPAGWLFIARPIGIDAINDIKPGTDGCPGPENCLRVISGIGTPILWWVGILALLAAIVWWIGGRDWRFAVPVLGVASTWITWFPNSDRPLFFFYAIMIIPFTCIALALAIGKLLGPANGPHRRVAGIIAGSFVALVILNFAFIYPILTDKLLPHSHWMWRMWFPSWI